MGEYVLTLLAAATVTYLLTPAVRRLAVAVGAEHAPRSRDVHAVPTPLLGGFAIYAGLAAGLLVASRMPALTGAFAEPNMVKGLLLAGGLVVVMGFVDDRWGLGAISKLAGQVAAGVILVWSGAEVTWLPLPGASTLGLTSDQQVAATILLVVVTINAVNFIDGLDGLATGIVGIGAAAFFVYYYTLTHRLGLPDQTGPALASAVLVGVCLGFLPHNFYPARIFMGDTGAMLLGLLLAYAPISSLSSLDPGSLTDHAAYAAGTVNRFGAFVPLLLPAAIMLIPYADLLMAVVRRTRAGTSPFSADMKHLHHRLMAIGHSHRTAVLIMYLWAGLFAGCVAWLSIVRTSLYVLIIVTGSAAAILCLVFVSLPRLRPWSRSPAPKAAAGPAAGPQAPGLAPVHVNVARPAPAAPFPEALPEAPGRHPSWNPGAGDAAEPAPFPGEPAPFPGEPAFPGGSVPFPGEPAAFNGKPASFPGDAAPLPGEPAPYPGKPAAFNGERSAFPAGPAPFPGDPAPFPGEPAEFRSGPSPYPGEPYPGQPSPLPGEPAPYPGEPATFAGEPVTWATALSASPRPATPPRRPAQPGPAAPAEQATRPGPAAYPEPVAHHEPAAYRESVSRPEPVAHHEPTAHREPTAYPWSATHGGPAGPASSDGTAPSGEAAPPEPGWSSWFSRDDVPPAHLVEPAPWPGFGPAEPDIPARGPAVPERAPATPERRPAASERGPATPERGRATPERGPAVPERGPVNPERPQAMHAPASVQPSQPARPARPSHRAPSPHQAPPSHPARLSHAARPSRAAGPAPAEDKTPGWPNGDAKDPEDADTPTVQWPLSSFPDVDPRLPASIQDRR